MLREKLDYSKRLLLIDDWIEPNQDDKKQAKELGFLRIIHSEIIDDEVLSIMGLKYDKNSNSIMLSGYQPKVSVIILDDGLRDSTISGTNLLELIMNDINTEQRIVIPPIYGFSAKNEFEFYNGTYPFINSLPENKKNEDCVSYALECISSFKDKYISASAKIWRDQFLLKYREKNNIPHPQQLEI